MIRCISCRKDIIDFVQARFEGFQVTLPLPGLKQDNCYITFGLRSCPPRSRGGRRGMTRSLPGNLP